MIETMAFGLEGSASFGNDQLFQGLHLDVKLGWTCLLGASGAGKTTILRLLAGLPTGAQFEGKIIRPDRLAFMAQADLLQERLSVLNNVLLNQRLRGQKPDMSRAAAMLQSVGLDGMEKRCPASLSGGQRQRVALARALMEDTRLVLLDEPFSGLDGPNRTRMQDLAFSCLKGKHMLLVTHDPLEALRLGKHLKLLEGGRIHDLPSLLGAPPHATDSPPFIEAYHKLVSRLAGIR